MKKLLFIPLDYYVKPHMDWFNSFQKLYKSFYYQDEHSAILFNPDYIFVHSSSIKPEILRRIKDNTNAIVIQWAGDCQEGLLESVIAYKGVADITCLAVGIAQKEMYEKALEHEVYYLQHAPYESTFRAINEKPNDKIIFIGNNHGHYPGGLERNKLCEQLSSLYPNFEVIGSGYNLPIYNNTRTIDYFESIQLYTDSFISISHNCFNDFDGYYSNRQLDIMAAGGCCLTRYIPKLENYFTDKEHCLFYKTNDEAVEIIKNLTLAERNRIAKAGQEFVRVYDSYDERIRQIKNIIKNAGK